MWVSIKKLLGQNKASFSLLVWTGLMPLLVSSTIAFYAIHHEASIRVFEWPTWAGLFVASVFTMAFALTPTTFVALFVGFFLGLKGLFMLLPAYLLASFIGYTLALRVDGGKITDFLNQSPKVALVLSRLKTAQFKLIVMARLSPALPFAVMNVVFAVLAINVRKFLVAGFIGMLPRTLLMVWAGSRAHYLQALLENPNGNDLLKISFFLLVGLSFWGIYLLIRRAFHNLY